MMRAMTRLLRPIVEPETYRRALFSLVQLGLGVAGFTLLIAGWTVTLVLAITPLVVPLLIGLRIAVGLLAAAEASVARKLLGVDVRPRISTPGVGFWNRGFNVLRDAAFWKQQAQLLMAWPLALLVLAPVSWAVEFVSLPVWYRWVDSHDVFGFLEVDSFVETLPIAALGLGLLVGVAHLLGPWSRLNGWLASWLLAGDGQEIVRSPAEWRALRRRAFTIDVLVSTVIVAGLVVIWFLTGEDYFWPIWPILSLSLVVAIPGWVYLVLEHPAPRRLARAWLPIAKVEDDGHGGAVASGNGLTGLRQRVASLGGRRPRSRRPPTSSWPRRWRTSRSEALDGTLEVTSPTGGPTTVRTELPCAS